MSVITHTWPRPDAGKGTLVRPGRKPKTVCDLRRSSGYPVPAGHGKSRQALRMTRWVKVPTGAFDACDQADAVGVAVARGLKSESSYCQWPHPP